LLSVVDDLAEAAFSGRALLERLVDDFSRPGGPWAPNALTAHGIALAVDLLRTLLELAPRRLDLQGSGALLIASELARVLGDGDQPRFGAGLTPEVATESRAALRMLAAYAGPDHSVDPADRPGGPRLALHYDQAA